ncbi:MAG: hypothetical protein U9R52_00760 [Candidatus Omnitrophota bacterium]|nr:hypothetical protein [Candidatus Omnitrophota bacterium]
MRPQLTPACRQAGTERSVSYQGEFLPAGRQVSRSLKVNYRRKFTFV